MRRLKLAVEELVLVAAVLLFLLQVEEWRRRVKVAWNDGFAQPCQEEHAGRAPISCLSRKSRKKGRPAGTFAGACHAAIILVLLRLQLAFAVEVAGNRAVKVARKIFQAALRPGLLPRAPALRHPLYVV